ncbi:hypothetical protein [Streptomyces sp. DSS69]|uniref:AMIN-like domain-containing (lipo)protein n=1 Tax=Streptomyces sp. DSS69 TaxID=3113369 RepID=UPI0031F9A67B
MSGWSNVAVASTTVLALAACGSGEVEDAQSKPVAATSSESSQTPSAAASSTSTSEKGQENESGEPPKVTEARVAETAEGDRVIFTFNGPAPDYLDSWEKELNGAEGKPIKIKGSKFLRIAFVGVSPDSRFTSPAPNERVLEVRYLMNFEGEMSVGIGIVAPDGAADPEHTITAEGTQVIVDIKE